MKEVEIMFLSHKSSSSCYKLICIHHIKYVSILGKDLASEMMSREWSKPLRVLYSLVVLLGRTKSIGAKWAYKCWLIYLEKETECMT